MAGERKGTGKHPHKSSEEPYPHHQAGKSGEHRESGREESRESSSSSSSEDLKEREYRDEKGQVHHHTRTYEEQHK